MHSLRNKVGLMFVALAVAITGAIVAFQMASSNGPTRLDAQLLKSNDPCPGNSCGDPQPSNGKDCPPKSAYGAPGRQKHCTGTK